MKTVKTMKEQYAEIVRELPKGMVVLFLVGEFYVAIGEAATVAAPILGVPLSRRDGSPFCGVPRRSIDTYLAKLVRTGKSVAMCERIDAEYKVTRLVNYPAHALP